VFRILGKGLGCVLIKSTLGPGKTQKGWKLGREGYTGATGDKKETVYEQPGTEVDIPVTAGGCQVSRNGVVRGSAMYRIYCNLCRMHVE
jgi:hypothetical protein